MWWFSVTAIFFVVLLIFPSFGSLSDEINITWALVIAGTFSVILAFIYYLIRAPDRIYSSIKAENGALRKQVEERDARISNLQENMRPRLRFGDVKIVIDNDEQRATIEIFNDGNSVLRECLARLEAISFEGGSTDTVGAALRTEARLEDEHVGRFSLTAGQPKKIVLVRRQLGSHRAPRPHEIMTERGARELHRGHNGVMELSAGCEIGKAERIHIRFSIGQDYSLSLEKLPNPNESGSHQPPQETEAETQQ